MASPAVLVTDGPSSAVPDVGHNMGWSLACLVAQTYLGGSSLSEGGHKDAWDRHVLLEVHLCRLVPLWSLNLFEPVFWFATWD